MFLFAIALRWLPLHVFVYLWSWLAFFIKSWLYSFWLIIKSTWFYAWHRLLCNFYLLKHFWLHFFFHFYDLHNVSNWHWLFDCCVFRVYRCHAFYIFLLYMLFYIRYYLLACAFFHFIAFYRNLKWYRIFLYDILCFAHFYYFGFWNV